MWCWRVRHLLVIIHGWWRVHGTCRNHSSWVDDPLTDSNDFLSLFQQHPTLLFVFQCSSVLFSLASIPSVTPPCPSCILCTSSTNKFWPLSFLQIGLQLSLHPPLPFFLSPFPPFLSSCPLEIHSYTCNFIIYFNFMSVVWFASFLIIPSPFLSFSLLHSSLHLSTSCHHL